MKLSLVALSLAALPLLATAQPAPPDLNQLPPAEAASAPDTAASAPLKRRCVAGCDGKSARVTWTEDDYNRFEVHRNNHDEVARVYVHPKNGSPKYELDVAADRQRRADILRDKLDPNANVRLSKGQSLWPIKDF